MQLTEREEWTVQWRRRHLVSSSLILEMCIFLDSVFYFIFIIREKNFNNFNKVIRVLFCMSKHVWAQEVLSEDCRAVSTDLWPHGAERHSLQTQRRAQCAAARSHLLWLLGGEAETITVLWLSAPGVPVCFNATRHSLTHTCTHTL